MHGLVRCKHECRCSRACGADVSFRDVTIKIPDRRCDKGCGQGCEWRHLPEAWAEIWEKSVSWVLASEEDGWLLGLAEARPVALRQVSHVVWGRWKSQLFPYVEKSLNSKVIKSFVPELRSCKCFSYFGIPMLSIYMSYEHSMYISHICIWLCNIKTTTKPIK